MQRATEVGLGLTYLSMFGEVTLRRVTEVDGTKEWIIGVRIDDTFYPQGDKDLLDAINRLIAKVEEIKDVQVN